MTGPTQRPAWDAIVQRALLGTERSATAPALPVEGALGAFVRGLDAGDPERTLLASAALVGAYEAAGRLPSRVTLRTTDQAMPESEDLAPAPPRVARFLVTMLGGVNDDVLPEWLAIVAAHRWRAPTQLLPALLDAGRTSRDLRTGIAAVLGGRGRWLAAHNEEWRYAAGSDAPSSEADLRPAWETGTRDERVAILEDVRARDSALGRALVESTWTEDSPPDRAAFVESLATGLAPEDEPFLERALSDRRQEVRRAAAELLRRLPTTALVARMTAHARAALAWKPGKLVKRAEIVVEPARELDPTMLRDGIEKAPPAGMGERAWWLAQIIAVVPPRTWSSAWSASPGALISAAEAGEWGKALTEGWAAAAVRHRDVEWAEALLASGFPGDRPTPIGPDLRELLGVLPVDRREAYVASILRDHPTADAVAMYVAAAEHPWSEKFARAVLTWMRQRVAAAVKKGSSTDWLLRETIPKLALRIPPTVRDATENWPTGDDAGGWERPLERFISTLTFRRELHEELER